MISPSFAHDPRPLARSDALAGPRSLARSLARPRPRPHAYVFRQAPQRTQPQSRQRPSQSAQPSLDSAVHRDLYHRRDHRWTMDRQPKPTGRCGAHGDRCAGACDLAACSQAGRASAHATPQLWLSPRRDLGCAKQCPAAVWRLLLCPHRGLSATATSARRSQQADAGHCLLGTGRKPVWHVAAAPRCQRKPQLARGLCRATV